MLEDERRRDAIRAAKLYYLDDHNQSWIAGELGVSRATVSRLLRYAREQGLVEIHIKDPLEDEVTLAEELRDRYHLAAVKIVATGQATGEEKGALVGQAAASYLETIVENGDTIGIGWGKTIHQVALALRPEPLIDVRVVQMKGAANNQEQPTYAYESIQAFATAFHTFPEYLPLPVIFDQATTKQLVESDRQIARVIELGNRAPIAVFTVGTVRDSALLFKLGYFTKEEQNFLQQHAVGDVFSRFIDRDGQIVSPTINDRTIGIQLDQLRQKKHSVLVATGLAKVPAVAAALTGGYANALVIDQDAAMELIRMGAR
ncbi:sugar-binding transcriptional regulator [Limosilactobacillus fermentum]|uniref:Sugar-binding domain-containing protein n=1 Tax=Limosilactobacillus fermentum TaxID=1613 RepID=A0A1D7ZUE8_LIMFE|nr:sugar-binding transcriptional regulator [Limosilactobacillus fermentum]AOR73510.1 hypothetical protein LACFE_CDS0027 [Limosilactobacillus fermentum]